MKPGVQRDLLAAFWLLFDEFEIGNDSHSSTRRGVTREMTEARAASAEAVRLHNLARTARSFVSCLHRA